MDTASPRLEQKFVPRTKHYVLLATISVTIVAAGYTLVSLWPPNAGHANATLAIIAAVITLVGPFAIAVQGHHLAMETIAVQAPTARPTNFLDRWWFTAYFLVFPVMPVSAFFIVGFDSLLFDIALAGLSIYLIVRRIRRVPANANRTWVAIGLCVPWAMLLAFNFLLYIVIGTALAS